MPVCRARLNLGAVFCKLNLFSLCNTFLTKASMLLPKQNNKKTRARCFLRRKFRSILVDAGKASQTTGPSI